jgi:hypothetical protein
MPLWTGSIFNNQVAALTVDNLYNDEAVNIVSEQNGLIFLLEQEKQNSNPRYALKMNRVKDIGGGKLRVKLLGKLPTVGTIANADQLTAQAYQSNSDLYNAALFDTTQYFQLYGMPLREFRQMQGDEAATKNWLVESVTNFKAAKRETVNVAINASVVGGTEIVLGNWQHAVSDPTIATAVAVGENTRASYGGLTRDADNVNYAGNVVDLNGAVLSLDNLADMRLRCKRKNVAANGPDVLLAGPAQYLNIQKKLEEKNIVQITSMDGMVGYGGEYFGYAGIRVCVDYHLAASTVGMLDSSTWLMWGDDTWTTSGWGEIHDRPAYGYKHSGFHAFIGLSPRNNGKFLRCG